MRVNHLVCHRAVWHHILRILVDTENVIAATTGFQVRVKGDVAGHWRGGRASRVLCVGKRGSGGEEEHQAERVHISGCAWCHRIVPPSGLRLRLSTLDEPKSKSRAWTEVPPCGSVRLSTSTLEVLRSPCTMQGSLVCKYHRARQTPIRHWHRAASDSPSVKECTNCCRDTPPQYSNTSATSRAISSSHAPWNSTVFGCRSRLWTRISSPTSARLCSWCIFDRHW